MYYRNRNSVYATFRQQNPQSANFVYPYANFNALQDGLGWAGNQVRQGADWVGNQVQGLRRKVKNPLDNTIQAPTVPGVEPLPPPYRSTVQPQAPGAGISAGNPQGADTPLNMRQKMMLGAASGLKYAPLAAGAGVAAGGGYAIGRAQQQNENYSSHLARKQAQFRRFMY